MLPLLLLSTISWCFVVSRRYTLTSVMAKLTPLVQSRPIFTAREIGRKMRGVFNAA